jgi:dienelactone hydrolase
MAFGIPWRATKISVRKKTRMRAIFFRTAFVLVTAAMLCAARAESPGAQGQEQGPWREQAWLIPSSVPGLMMHATLLRPPGRGPFPLMVMNHGSTQSAEQRGAFSLPAYRRVSRWFVDHGYAVVLPQRPGHGETGGPYLEDQKSCGNPDFLAAGRGAAVSIAATIAYMTEESFIRRNGVVVVGQSAGGWGALALASQNPSGVRAVINFAGGRGGRSYDRPNSNCEPDRLIDTARTFGSTARLPTLWLYSENDTYFGPALSRKLAEAFRTAGGRIEYHLLPPVGTDGHQMVSADAGEPLWGPVLTKFLDGLR